jgi:hypothetical protein
MKRIMLLTCIVAVGFLFSCATSQEMGKKLSTGDFVEATYDYDWERVYEAVRYVLQNSNAYPIATVTSTQFSHIKYHYKEKVIFIMVYSISARDIELAIYFEPESKSKTKVKFIKGLTLALADTDDAIKYIIDESQFFLKNDGQGYIKYTDDNAAKWEEENRKKSSK